MCFRADLLVPRTASRINASFHDTLGYRQSRRKRLSRQGYLLGSVPTDPLHPLQAGFQSWMGNRMNPLNTSDCDMLMLPTRCIQWIPRQRSQLAYFCPSKMPSNESLTLPHRPYSGPFSPLIRATYPMKDSTSGVSEGPWMYIIASQVKPG